MCVVCCVVCCVLCVVMFVVMFVVMCVVMFVVMLFLLTLMIADTLVICGPCFLFDSHTFRLKHVHGMANSPGTHSHVHYINRGTEIVYSAGKIVVVQDLRTNKAQRFFTLHNFEGKEERYGYFTV